MHKILHVFDLLPFIHAGHINKASFLEQLIDYGSTYKTQVTPTGGTSWILSSLYTAMQTGDIVIATDRNATIKKDLYSGYKASRAHKPEITVEKHVAEEILQLCNFTVIGRVGYEADDIIYSVVKKFYDSYDEIFIYTGDSDLYFLVDDKVSIKPSSSRAKEITRSNYEHTKVHGYEYRYNCITVAKIACGDASDNIPALPKDIKNKFMNLMYRDDFYTSLGNKGFVEAWTARACPEALDQVKLVFPLDVDDLPDQLKEPDRLAVMNWGNAVNNPILRGHSDPTFDPAPFVKEFQDKGYYLLEEGK